MIVGRQSSYWQVRAATGASYRVHFDDKVEFGFAAADYPYAELAARHPLLVAYDEPSRSLYFSGTAVSPATLAETLDRVIREVSDDWRALGAYAGRSADVQRRLAAGHGLLMNAPESVCARVAVVLDEAGVGTSTLGQAPARPGKRALLLGRSYVIATAFEFERRDLA